jgi:hypothetical protein
MAVCDVSAETGLSSVRIRSRAIQEQCQIKIRPCASNRVVARPVIRPPKIAASFRVGLCEK